MTAIRLFRQSDWTATWKIIEPVFRAGDVYSVDAGISVREAFRNWVEQPEATFVAEGESGRILGTYYLKANQPGPGAHVCNCGYIVGQDARGRGIASVMCEHSQNEATRRGFRAMQYNFVVATNIGAIKLWKRHGFAIVGTLPEAFHHPSEGYVDAFVMHKKLET